MKKAIAILLGCLSIGMGAMAGGKIALIQSAIAEPNQDDLNLTCRGTIDNRVDFTAYYTREAGFRRIDFRPRRANRTLTVSMNYINKNAQGRGVWRGQGNSEVQADVSLVHLSTKVPQVGDRISVGYDHQWGRATCR
ncbi:hypothetical protein [Limnofasciculus baicalensis]|uniref:Adhesin n=1 Tax=Limnofasciculus baicalensis BBK-W-15 TaxID=2699891 RepID=A0AAE3GSF5_9CYAN|nr:hypothetical protein [Limnofasciculus baicalensis]MCP2729008.1 hypothetical protein [Limnofasciculus baicalensis BBK-W-15]